MYGPRVVAALKVVAEATGWICGKRLKAALPDLVPALEREGALQLSEDVKGQLLEMSAATIDRKLSEARRRARPKGISTTKPGSLLKRQIPVRVYTPWDEEHPGFVEIDLVAHCGESTAGEHLWTLDVTDIATGWTELEPVLGKGQAAVFTALKLIRSRLPFPLLRIDSDNGSEFINAHLYRYCEQQKLTFTRGREYHKDDQAHVEQKNYTHVRQLVGYDRYEGEQALQQFRRIYELARVQHNLYLPAMKLVAKERQGAKVTKRYDEPKTPFKRAVEAGVIPSEQQLQLQGLMKRTGPMTLKRQLDQELGQLWAMAASQPAAGTKAASVKAG
ncbi:MAG: transposase [Chloroflexota bacterium]|nr:transposase [Chloroflexota bacterium]